MAVGENAQVIEDKQKPVYSHLDLVTHHGGNGTALARPESHAGLRE